METGNCYRALESNKSSFNAAAGGADKGNGGEWDGEGGNWRGQQSGAVHLQRDFAPGEVPESTAPAAITCTQLTDLDTLCSSVGKAKTGSCVLLGGKSRRFAWRMHALGSPWLRNGVGTLESLQIKVEGTLHSALHPPGHTHAQPTHIQPS